MKQKKCHYCKEILQENDDVIQFEMGNTKKIKKYAHAKCRQNSLQRKEFFDALFKILDIPTADKRTFTYIDSINKKGFSWEVMLHALKIKQKDIAINFDKGWGYTIAILNNQLPFSYKEIKKQNEIKNMKQKIKLLNQEEIEEIIVSKKHNKQSKIIQCEDMSEL